MTRWYAAHIILFARRKHDAAGKVPVWENIVLIKANSEDEAFAKAEARGKSDEGDDDGTFRWNGEPAEWVFAGVRKLTLCDDADKRPGDGSEITYTELEVNSEQSVRDLVAGKAVNVRVVDQFSEPPTRQNRSASAKQRA